MKTDRWQDAYLDRYYMSRPDWVGGTTEFHNLCAARIARAADILEIGAGPTNPTSRFLATIGRVTGVDLDPAVTGNEALVSAAVLSGDRYPFPDNTFDASVSNYVLEHVANPGEHLAEVARVLKPGGVYIFRTPNIYHYVSTVARLTPHFFHEWTSNRLRGLPEDSHEPYPTYHRLNSRRAIKRFAHAAGFEVDHLYLMEKEPSYGMSSRMLFLVFAAYERLVNALPVLEGFRSNIVGVLRKRA